MSSQAQMSATKQTVGLFLTVEGQNLVLQPRGEWIMQNLDEVLAALETVAIPAGATLNVDGSCVVRIDTAAATILYSSCVEHGYDPKAARLQNFAPEQEKLMCLVATHYSEANRHNAGGGMSPVAELGKATVQLGERIIKLLSFIGETTLETLGVFARPWQFRFSEFICQLEHVFVRALFVTVMMMFLVGVVIAYLLAVQLEIYGGTLLIVQGVSLAITRELSPVIVAIIIAGRSGSAFTAQLGSMKINEELDAMQTIGLSPMRVLVLPRFVALTIALPLLTFAGNIAGILGGVLVATYRLDITPMTFMIRLNEVFSFKSFWLGMGKAPVFASFIAVIACRMGLAVENNARSLGVNVTSTVVQSIVAVILLDSFFAVVFADMGL